MAPSETTQLVVSPQDEGTRLDTFLAQQFPAYSRVILRRVIQAGQVLVDGKRTKPAHRLAGGQQVRITLPPPPRSGPQPEDIPLDILYEDEALAVINKPPAMVVHPSRGHWSGTLAAALAFHFTQLSAVSGPDRPGIVHRLDRDTSGLLLVAKSDQVHLQLSRQFQERTVEKEYFAIVTAVPDRDRDLIEAPIGVHPYQREKMAIRAAHATSRDASTFFEVAERFDGFAVLRVLPKTGRTHQIRVHLAHIGCPVLCDRLYGGRSQITRGEIRRDPDDHQVLLRRHALHAHRLKLIHPTRHEPVQFEAPLPVDLASTLEELRRYRRLP